MYSYTDAEYNQYLSDDNWSKQETDYLFELCKRYDLRFFVVHDRWDPAQIPNAKNRSIDELKDRYYKVTGIMQKVRINLIFFSCCCKLVRFHKRDTKTWNSRIFLFP